MNNLEKERKHKLIKQIKDAIKLVKIEKEIRKNSEDQLKDKIGIQKTLEEFHKPVTQEIEKYEKVNKEVVKSIQNVVENISFPSIEEPIEAVKELVSVTYDIDQNLNLKYLKEEKLYRPSVFLNDQEKLEEMYAKAKHLKEGLSKKRGNLKSTISRAKNFSEEELNQKKNEIEEIKNKENMLQTYMNRLNLIRCSKDIKVGRGLDVLSNLTEKICNGSKSKKLYNQVDLLLDMLLKNKEMTYNDVQRYRKQFLC